MSEMTMNVAAYAVEAVPESKSYIQHRQVLAMVLRSGSFEVGLRRSDMSKSSYATGEMILARRHVDEWVRTGDIHLLVLEISDTALRGDRDGTSGEVELHHKPRLVDARVSALLTAVNAERAAGFPSGRLFLDSVERALAAVLVEGHAVRPRPVRTYRGGLAPARLRRVIELVHAKIEGEVTLDELAETAGLSAAHFSQMFRKSTGESPHQFVLRRRVEYAKQMLRAAETRVLDVAVACGFKTQQHFARVFRSICGASPTEYRQEFLR